jgi:hypothetical protein
VTPAELAKALQWRGEITVDRMRKALRHVENREHFEATVRAIPDPVLAAQVETLMRPMVEARFR